MHQILHQLISTISGTLEADTSVVNIIEATFPMGSMTGAPKQRVLQLIEQYEPVARGIFSGAVGYITPDGDFDLNVVIRSLMYNETTKYLSYQVGSGITFYSDAAQEWEECLLKGTAIKKVLCDYSTFEIRLSSNQFFRNAHLIISFQLGFLPYIKMPVR